jgi:hypothetical protein
VIIGVPCDVTSEQSVHDAFCQVVDYFGHIDSVVASAGTILIVWFVRCHHYHPPPRIVENYPALEFYMRLGGGDIASATHWTVQKGCLTSTFMDGSAPPEKRRKL